MDPIKKHNTLVEDVAGRTPSVVRSKLAAWWNKGRAGLVGLIVGLAVAIAVYLDAVEAIPVVLFPCLACLVWERLEVSGIGMAFWAASLLLMTWAGAIATRSEGNIFAIIPFVLLMYAALACILAAIVSMLITAWCSRSVRRRNLLGAVLAPVAAILFVCALNPLFHGARHLRIAGYFHKNGATLQALIDDVDVISQRLGRVPKDEEELVTLRKQPMPCIPWPHWGTHELSYHPIGEHYFGLTFGGIDAEGVYVYDSGKPERGWYHCLEPPWALNDTAIERDSAIKRESRGTTSQQTTSWWQKRVLQKPVTRQTAGTPGANTVWSTAVWVLKASAAEKPRPFWQHLALAISTGQTRNRPAH